jgi:hypothetical protein
VVVTSGSRLFFSKYSGFWRASGVNPSANFLAQKVPAFHGDLIEQKVKLSD